jgi:hypothetical protein
MICSQIEKTNWRILLVGVAFRDRNDAFDFGVVFQSIPKEKNCKNILNKSI